MAPLFSLGTASASALLPADNNPWFSTQFFHSRSQRTGFEDAVVEHVELTIVSVAAGFVVAFGLALLVRRFRRIEGPVLVLTDTVYAVPSIAGFSLLQPFFGLSLTGPVIALAAYVQLILVRNILEGLRSVPGDTVEAATGLGFGPVRRLFRDELPLALPAVFAGLRVATVSTVGLVTVAFALSHGGLGETLTIGYTTNLYKQQVLDAVIGTVVIALLFDALILGAQRLSTPWTRARRSA